MQTAVLVGAGRGVGNAIARRLAQEEFTVVLAARRKEKLVEYVADLATEGIEADVQVIDAGDDASVADGFAAITARHGTVDVMAFNAAVMESGSVRELDAADALHHWNVDVAGAIRCTQAVLPGQIEQGSGAVLFTGGRFGVHPNEYADFACMSMDKAALRSYAKMLNESLSGTGVFAGIVEIMGNVGSSEGLMPGSIAETAWKLYEEHQGFEAFCE